MYGTLERAAERWRLRFTRRLSHPPDKVWRAITERDHLKMWFPQEIVGEWRVGASLRFVSQHGDFDGEVVAFDPPRLVEFRWGTDTIRFEITPDGTGTIFTLLDTFDEAGKAARDAAGWHVCLDALERSLDGRGSEAPSGQQWQDVHAVYVERLGPEASTIGPPDTAKLNTR